MEHTKEEVNQQEELATDNHLQEQEAESVGNLESENNQIAAELAEMKDKYLRLYSEFENFRRRTAKEKTELITTANASLILALLPVVDDIERSQASIQQAGDVQALKEGVELIFSKLQKILENKGLKALQSKGELFNPDIHEAITQIPAPSDDLKGKIVDEIEKGYYLNEKLIRVAKVVIGA